MDKIRRIVLIISFLTAGRADGSTDPLVSSHFEEAVAHARGSLKKRPPEDDQNALGRRVGGICCTT